MTFITAYSDRSTQAFQKTFKNLAWGAFAWLASEPDNLIYLKEKEERHSKKTLSDILNQ